MFLYDNCIHYQSLKRYYEFMNMDEFIYNDNLTFNDIVLNGQAQFRISYPDNSNSEFFQDHNFANSTLLDSSGNAITTVKDSDGNSVPLQNNAGNIKITNGKIKLSLNINYIDYIYM